MSIDDLLHIINTSLGRCLLSKGEMFSYDMRRRMLVVRDAKKRLLYDIGSFKTTDAVIDCIKDMLNERILDCATSIKRIDNFRNVNLKYFNHDKRKRTDVGRGD